MGTFAECSKLKQRRFLRAFAKCGVIQYAADISGCHPRSHYDWLKRDPIYAEQFELADSMATDTLEKVARERALKNSDLLMIFLLKAQRPDKYREQTKIVGDSASPVQHEMRITVVRTDDRENYLPTQAALGPGTNS